MSEPADISVEDIRNMSMQDYAKARNQLGLPGYDPGWMTAATRLSKPFGDSQERVRRFQENAFFSAMSQTRLPQVQLTEIEQWQAARQKFIDGDDTAYDDMINHVRTEDGDKYDDIARA